VARLSQHGLRRVLGTSALFSTAYGNVGSSIYYALGLVASYALGLTPIVFLITGVIFYLTAATYAEAADQVIVVSTGDLEVGTTFPAESVQSGPVTAADIERWITPAGPENVSMLSMRHFMRNSGQLVSRSKEVLDAAREVAAVVIVETPAFLRYHHGEALVHSVDAVIVVVENGVTMVPDAQDMGDILRRLGAPVLGVVFTGEELSKSQKRVLDAGMAASGRTGKTPFPDADVDADDAVADDAGSGDGVGVPAPELHPS